MQPGTRKAQNPALEPSGLRVTLGTLSRKMAGRWKGTFLRDGSQLLFDSQQRSSFRNLKSLTPRAATPGNTFSFDGLSVWRPRVDASENPGNSTSNIPDQNDQIKTVECQEERVSDQNFDDWLARSQKHGGSTFILGPVIQSTNFGPKFRDFPRQTAFPLNFLPFPFMLYPKVEENLALPLATPDLLVSERTHFREYNMEYLSLGEQWTGFTMCLSSRGVINLNVCASISWRPNTGTVAALLQGCTSQQQARIRAQLEEVSILAFHPLLLPTILVGLKMSCLEEEEVILWNRLIQVEVRSKQTDAPPIGTEPVLAQQSGMAVRTVTPMIAPQGSEVITGDVGAHLRDSDNGAAQETPESELNDVTVAVLGVIQLTTYAESHAKALLLIIDGIRRGIETLNKKAGQSGDAEYITAAGKMLSEKLAFLEQRTQVVMADIAFVEKRAQAQQAAVYNYLAQREAKAQRKIAVLSSLVAQASKRDSSAMKAIAVLTMAFLPGTFLAVRP
ncbi:hypothetical protein DL765_004989 [Monosporascus sp. GIB2]|nr:hypothetical protein DL765_004989 [Monosporascus sp. GIB2]